MVRFKSKCRAYEMEMVMSIGVLVGISWESLELASRYSWRIK